MDCPGVLWVVGVNLGNGLAGVTGGAGALIEGAGVLEGGAGVLEGGAEVLEEGAEELMGGAPYLPPSFFCIKSSKSILVQGLGNTALWELGYVNRARQLFSLSFYGLNKI